MDIEGPGLVDDGTQCGDSLVCLSQCCVAVSQISTMPCETASNGLVCSCNGVSDTHGLIYALQYLIILLYLVYTCTYRYATIGDCVLVMWALLELAVKHHLQDQVSRVHVSFSLMIISSASPKTR